jgi:adenine phosphoribosyltransferase
VLYERPISERLSAALRDIIDFPKPGVVFKDITPLLGNHANFHRAVEALADPFREARVTHVVGVEARGFILAAPVALALGAGFVPVRKPGKLPAQVTSESYHLEYGTDSLEIHTDAFSLPSAGEPHGKASDAKVLIVDDVLATGGTAKASVKLVERLGATVVGLSVLIELLFLPGRATLGDVPINALISVGNE